MTTTDFEMIGEDLIAYRWRHPETDVVINGEDMPWELKPHDHD